MGMEGVWTLNTHGLPTEDGILDTVNPYELPTEDGRLDLHPYGPTKEEWGSTR